MQQGNLGEYSFFAFISYKREDIAWAKKLEKKLQAYRLPAHICKTHRDLPQRLSPVFLDLNDMSSGKLHNNMRKETQASKYLIVICSKQMGKDTEYIDQEIRYFLETHDSSHVIPFIVDDSPAPEKECFSPELKKICAQDEIVGINIHDAGERRAFIKLVAYMHGLRPEELESWEDRRRRKNRIITAICALMLLFAAGFTGYGLWDYYVPKVNYFVDYTTKFGVPVGIGELSKEEIAVMQHHYTIVQEKGHVVELRHENSAGTLMAYENIVPEGGDRPVRASYAYYPEGGLERVTNYDTGGKVTLVMKYSPNAKVVDLISGDEYDTASALLMHNATSGASQLAGTGLGSVEFRSSVVRYVAEYSTEGYLVERRYAANTANTAAGDADGVFGLRYERDELGRAVRIEYLGLVGAGDATNAGAYAPAPIKTGISGIAYSYEGFDLAEVLYFGEDEMPMPGSDGWAIMRNSYDQRHHILCKEILDANGESVFSNDGCVSIEAEYDERGNMIRQTVLGMDGEPVINSYGFSSEKIRYNDRGYMISAAYYGTDGEPVACINGYASWKAEYDAQGRMVHIAYFGVDGESVPGDLGYASRRSEFDENGNNTRNDYFGVDGKPVIGIYGNASGVTEYDAHGRITYFAYLGTNGEPVLGYEGYAAFRAEYDERGNRTKTEYFGVDGESTASIYGYACEKMEYDAQGNMINAEFYGTDGEPVMTADGYAGWSAEYDVRGNKIAMAYFGVDGERVIGAEGWSSWVSEYDKWGNATYMAFYGTNGEPVLNYEACAGWRKEYDERGNVLRAEFFGTDGELVVGRNGSAMEKAEYDARGNRIYAAVFGVDGKPMISSDGWSSWRSEYDERGNIIYTQYFGIDGEPVITAEGCASWSAQYDERGNRIRVEYYGVKGELVISAEGCAGWRAEYDGRRNRTQMEFLGADGQSAIGVNGYAKRLDNYDASGIYQDSQIYDAQGNLMEFCMICFRIDPNTGTLENGAYIISRFGEWDYRDYNESAEAVSAFWENFNKVQGKMISYELVNFDAQQAAFRVETIEGTVGKLGIQLREYAMSLEDRTLMMQALG